MAVSEMRRLNLVAMSYDKDALLNALQRTNATEVKCRTEEENAVIAENTAIPVVDTEELKGYLASLETALGFLCAAVDEYNKDNKVKSKITQDGFEVSYSDFMAAADKKAEADAVAAEINRLITEKNALKAEIAKQTRIIEQEEIYRGLQTPFSRFSGTAHTKAWLGTFSSSQKGKFLEEYKNAELLHAEFLAANSEDTLIFMVAHKSDAEKAEGILSECGFAPCPFASGETAEETGKELYARLKKEYLSLKKALRENAMTMYALNDKIRPLKVYCDYVSFELEKREVSQNMRETAHTFLMEAYVPAEAEEAVKEAILSVTNAAYFEFTPPSEEETPPTLLKNGKAVENFESLTNTYSTPNYREFDPNAVMAIFYSIFMGFIIGDMGYGLLMMLGGGLIYFKKKGTSFAKMCMVFAIGGGCAVVWGALFNSLFGTPVFAKSILPNPQEDMWTFVGISVPGVLIISLLIGVVQLGAGYACRAYQLWRRDEKIDAICDGGIWTIFSLGVGLAIVGLIEEADMGILASIGGVIAGVSLLAAMLTAGRKEKFLGKVTKGFGAAYGIINYASDILSYARLYGLMLSGAVIAQIISNYSLMFIGSGQIFSILLGVILMIVGHGFNLAMNLLGAYIHDSRLQYVEFYGKFFEGEGELFVPLGSEHKYVRLMLPEPLQSAPSAAERGGSDELAAS